ncbi:MAG: hypothetical protein K8S20_15685 [Chloroflexi bacterium]|nr:hypothetical protein [Chloroflexota bacterium]
MTAAVVLLIILLLIALALDFTLISGWKKYRALTRDRKTSNGESGKLHILKQAFLSDEANPLTRLLISAFTNRKFQTGLQTTIELAVLALWALWLGRDYLNMNPLVIPTGREFGSTIQANFLWTQAAKCGSCALWNGFQRGGYPAFADIQGSMLHPIVIITTLIWGVINGAKVSLLLSFWFAGIAQWWIARELSLSWIPRMWSSFIAIAGGHLASRMELGVYGVVLATAMTSLVFAAFLRLGRTNERRDAVLLGIITASAIVSGQGYIQVGLIAIIPMAAYFLIFKQTHAAVIWKNYLLALVIALLLAAPLLIPLIHFGPNIVKETDPKFLSAQPIQYFILNLVIDDPVFFRSNLLGKLPYPYLYSLYIGWVPVVLAIFALNKFVQKDRAFINFLFWGAVTEFLVGSAILLKFIYPILPQVSGVRHSPQIAGLAIPMILGLSAYGLEKLLAETLQARDSFPFLRSRWKPLIPILFLIPLIQNIQNCYQFSQGWIGTTHIPTYIYKTLEILRTNDLQWVEPPFGEHAFIAPAISMGMKISPGILTWNWRGHEIPSAVRYATRSGSPPGDVRKTGNAFGFSFFSLGNHPYAGILTSKGMEPCTATGSGGHIDVTCNSSRTGTLIVQENYWSGWQARLDGIRTPLFGKQRLEVHAPSGLHHFTFRYNPWDAPMGVGLFVVGCFVSIAILRLPVQKGINP